MADKYMSIPLNEWENTYKPMEVINQGLRDEIQKLQESKTIFVNFNKRLISGNSPQGVPYSVIQYRIDTEKLYHVTLNKKELEEAIETAIGERFAGIPLFNLVNQHRLEQQLAQVKFQNETLLKGKEEFEKGKKEFGADRWHSGFICGFALAGLIGLIILILVNR